MKIQSFDYSVDILQTLLWQFNEAENLEGLLTLKQEWYNENQSEFWESWVRDVFDLRTANDFGLSVWSIILDVPLYGDNPASGSGFPAFGFGSLNNNFGNGNFATLGGTFNQLSTEQRRLLLRLRYYQLVSSGSIPEINEFLSFLFGRGVVYALDGLDMTITYVFTQAPTSDFLYVLETFDILPRPSGVKINIITSGRPLWGFGESRQNFENGNFGATE